MAELRVTQEVFTSRVRGMLVGFALGDTFGYHRGPVPDGTPQAAGTATHQLAFATEGLIRAHQRSSHKGICHAPSVVWHALNRWASVQGVPVRPGSGIGDPDHPDGWLAQVPQLARRRGSAPATVSALTHGHMGSADHPVSTSKGYHCLTRALPVAVDAAVHHRPAGARMAAEFALLTHGHPHAGVSGAYLASIAATCLLSERDAPLATLQTAVNDTMSLGRGYETAGEYLAVLDDGFATNSNRGLRLYAPRADGPSALAGALWSVAAASSDQPASDGFAAAVFDVAVTAPHPASVTAVAGALVGALAGVEAFDLPTRLEHEIGFVMDTLGRDLSAQFLDSPGGQEHVPARDPEWWDRYPGW